MSHTDERNTAPKGGGVQPKTLRATITIDMVAADYMEAGDHQRRLEAELDQIRRDYPDAWLIFSGRRPACEDEAPPRRGVLRRSGRLNDYE
jgi:hypothetical protein